MPAVVEAVIGVVALIVIAAAALWMFWHKTLCPVWLVLNDAVKLAPLLRKFMDDFGPEKVATLSAIAKGFTTDSDATREAMSSLERSITSLQLSGAASDQMSAEDRRDRVSVAEQLATAQKAVDGVADDLKEAHRRADEVDGPHGAAADAAAQQTAAERET